MEFFPAWVDLMKRRIEIATPDTPAQGLSFKAADEVVSAQVSPLTMLRKVTADAAWTKDLTRDEAAELLARLASLQAFLLVRLIESVRAPEPRHGVTEDRMTDQVRMRADIAEGSSRQEEYLTYAELAERIHYSPQSLRNMKTAGMFKKGVHYVQPRGRPLFLWSAMQRWLSEHATNSAKPIPLARGGTL
jgi:hypothetical protein